MAFPKQFKAETIARHEQERLERQRNNVKRAWIFWHLEKLDSEEFKRKFPKKDAELDKKYPPKVIAAERAEKHAGLQREAKELGIELEDLTTMTKAELKSQL